MGDAPPPNWRPVTMQRSVEEHGWLKRPDIGPDVWEKPDGTLYQAEPGKAPPRIVTLHGWRSPRDA